MLRTIVPGLASRPRVRGEALRRARERQETGRVQRPARPRPEQRLASSAGFTRRPARPEATPRSPFAVRPLPLAGSFLLTTIWFLANVQRISPLDVLPFAWTWLTLWIVASVVHELWRRYSGSSVGGD